MQALTDDFIEPNTDLAATIGTLKLTWEWEFPFADNNETDQKDTVLGNLAADSTLQAKYNGSAFESVTEGTDYNLHTKVKVDITVTQVD